MYADADLQLSGVESKLTCLGLQFMAMINDNARGNKHGNDNARGNKRKPSTNQLHFMT
jgi:hypothetical protein